MADIKGIGNNIKNTGTALGNFFLGAVLLYVGWEVIGEILNAFSLNPIVDTFVWLGFLFTVGLIFFVRPIYIILQNS